MSAKKGAQGLTKKLKQREGEIFIFEKNVFLSVREKLDQIEEKHFNQKKIHINSLIIATRILLKKKV